MSNEDNRNNYSKDDEKRHYGMGQGWSGHGDEKEPEHKSDLMAAAEGALVGALGGALVGGIGGVVYNEFQKHRQQHSDETKKEDKSD